MIRHTFTIGKTTVTTVSDSLDVIEALEQAIDDLIVLYESGTDMQVEEFRRRAPNISRYISP